MNPTIFQTVFYVIAIMCFIYIALIFSKIIRLFSDKINKLKDPICFTLDSDDFDCLVRGGVLNVSLLNERMVRIALRDIGFGVMGNIVNRAASNSDNHRKDHNKIIT